MTSKLVFSLILNTGGGFNCRLRCGQCVQMKPNGQRCKNRVCIGFPTCWQHTLQKYGLKVKQSSIPGAGNGLFTKRAILEGEYICPYTGEVIDQSCLDARYPGNILAPYAIEFGQRYIDAACSRGIGSIANSLFSSNNFPMSVENHNAIFTTHPNGRLWLQATRNIEPDSEIFVWYGDSYELHQVHHETKRSKKPDTRLC